MFVVENITLLIILDLVLSNRPKKDQRQRLELDVARLKQQ
jgi:hypothetical protein